MKSYQEAGVDIDKGDRFVDFIKSIKSKAVDSGIGGFSSAIPLGSLGYKNPVLMSTTDGVGTKILVARSLGKFDTVGIDLVAMNVNDLIVCGARPLVFLDYIACGRINEPVMQDIMRGIVKGCEQAECVLGGGETAEMPDVYGRDDFDLAGFAMGICEKDQVLPKLSEIRAGDLILGLPSSGVHSNGFSLARKAVPESNRAAWAELLVPTIIYTMHMRTLIAAGGVLGAAHITGSGLFGNLPRVIPQGLVPRLTFDWDVPPIFGTIQKSGGLSDDEMRKVFNLGIGIAVVARKGTEGKLMDAAQKGGFPLLRIGVIENG